MCEDKGKRFYIVSNLFFHSAVSFEKFPSTLQILMDLALHETEAWLIQMPAT